MSNFLDKKLVSLKPYVPGLQPKRIDGLVKLNTNESPFPPSPLVLDAVSKGVNDLNLYSDDKCTRAVSAIAAFHGLSTDNVFLSNGSDETLAFIFHGLCQNGAAFADITYGFFKVYSSMFGVKETIVPLNDNYKINIDDYKDIKSTVFIANPNALTGILLPLIEIEKLIQQDLNRLVIVDEAYIDFGGESAVELIDKYKNLIVVQTFSKSRSLAGGRIGFAIADKELIADLNTLKYSFNPYNVNSLSILAAEAAMSDKPYFEECRKTIIENRNYLTNELRSQGFIVLESSANFIFAGQNNKIKAVDYYSELRKNNILVRYFTERRTADFVRITIGTMEQMQRLTSITENILKEHIK
ncbi:MAG: histidinol-phosphate transaminase [Clostridiales bacterium GWF2_36_10]|nr:MAG: histidinol-phosphate transaminase [Clostridiales bacterium GWF2_36_10]HAN21616.1 histidinol-phosphate transaminase [Clostridiales bacterium]